MNELTERAVIAIWGPEAGGFLQGLITNDVEKAANGLYAALLTPQGKILFDFLISEQDGALLLDCRRDSLDALVKRLTMYKLRAKLEIKARDDLGIFVGEGSPDPRLAALGLRAIAARKPAPPGDAAYLAQRLELGVPEGDDFGSDKIFALDANLGELSAVSFDKGCYVGQELTARMKHRGTARKRLLPVSTLDGSPLLRDAPLKAGGQEIGTVTSAYGARGFALVRLDRLAENADPIEAGGVPVCVTKPSWLFP